MTAPAVNPFTSTSSFALPQRSGTTTGTDGEKKVPSLASLIRVETGDLYGVKPPEKSVLKHAVDESLSMLTYDA